MWCGEGNEWEHCPGPECLGEGILHRVHTDGLTLHWVQRWRCLGEVSRVHWESKNMRTKTWATSVHGFGAATGKTSVWKIPGCWIRPGWEGALFKRNHWGSQSELAGAWEGIGWDEWEGQKLVSRGQAGPMSSVWAALPWIIVSAVQWVDPE